MSWSVAARTREEVVREIEAHAARDDEAPEEAIAGEPLVHLLEALLQAHPGGGAVVERGAGADVADVADVVVEPLQLERDAPDEPGPRRGVDAGDLLERLAVAEAVRDRADSADTLGDVERVERREALHPLLQPAMRVEQARVEMEHGLADRREAEVTRLDDAGVDRADRDLEDALAFGDEVRELVGGLDRDAPRPVERLAEREDARGHPSWTTSGRGSGCPTGTIPNRSCISRSCQFAAGTAVVREGTSGRAASTETSSVTNRSGAPGGGGLEDVAHFQIAVRRRRLVGRHDRGQGHRVRPDEHGGRRRKIAGATEAHREVRWARADAPRRRSRRRTPAARR